MPNSALIATIPTAEPAVAGWRSEHDPIATRGIPAHVTVLYPFVATEEIDAALLGELGNLFASHRRFDSQFSRFDEFPEGVLWLAPEPEDQFRALMKLAIAQFPDYPPYGGKHADTVPHLTIAHAQSESDRATWAVIRAAIEPQLPISYRVSSVTFMGEDADGWWSTLAAFPLAKPYPSRDEIHAR